MRRKSIELGGEVVKRKGCRIFCGGADCFLVWSFVSLSSFIIMLVINRHCFEGLSIEQQVS